MLKYLLTHSAIADNKFSSTDNYSIKTMNNIQIPIQKLAESPKASESVMTISVRDRLPLGDAIVQTLRIFAKDATAKKTQPKKPAA